jgi:hypothetical protein
LDAGYEAAHVRLFLEAVEACRARRGLLERQLITPLSRDSQPAADQSYIEAVVRLGHGLETVLKSYKNSTDAQKARIFNFFSRTTETFQKASTF